jgi:hemolysin D
MFIHVFKELFIKYMTIFSGVWAVRHELDPIARNNNELAFLPAALELQENPPHPLGLARFYSDCSCMGLPWQD